MKRFLALGISLLVVVAFVACEKADMEGKMDIAKQGTAPTQETPEEAPQPTFEPTAVATIVVGDTPFSVEIAKTDEERAKGLMGRESLPKDYGMWFVFPQEGLEKFWMKDTLIPLDIIYVDEDMKVVHVIENASPGSTELLSSPTPFMYVLEVNGGDVEKKGIKVGDSVEKRVGSDN